MKQAHLLILASLLIGTIFGPMLFEVIAFLMYILGGLAGIIGLIYLYGVSDEQPPS